jgi:RNA polymerase sigma-70 factor (ECF subfamily)
VRSYGATVPARTNITPTDPKLLERLKQRSDPADWQLFDATYRDYLLSVVREYGIHKDDAEDVVQNAMLGVLAALDAFEYDRTKGSFRGWLKTIARRRAIDYLRQNPRTQHLFVAPQPNTGSTAFLEKLADPRRHDAGDNLDHDYHYTLLQEALAQLARQMNPRHVQAFKRLTLDAIPAPEVVENFGVSVDQLYVWKSRIIARLKKVFAKSRS